MSRPNDPTSSFRFRVAIDQVERGGFAKVGGLAREMKFESYHEGGQNEFEHKLASMATYGNLVLERGLLDANLWDWGAETAEGRVERRDMTIMLLNQTGEESWRWIVSDAWPVKWAVSDLDASSAQVVFEAVEFAHHGVLKG